jgi:glycosyltransferase involved in cell wall biosynthesis
MIIIEYSPDREITGILRLTLRVIRALSIQTDIALLMGLEHPGYLVPDRCTIKIVKQNSLKSLFDDDLLLEIQCLPHKEVRRSEIEVRTIFFPRWRPNRKFFAREVGIIYDCSPLFRNFDFKSGLSDYFTEQAKLAQNLNDSTLTISDFTHDQTSSCFSFEPHRLKRIYPGPSFNIEYLLSRRKSRSKLSGTRPYCIFMGSLDPRKGIFELLSWWNANQRDRSETKLIIVGAIPTWSPDVHRIRIQSAIENSENVEFLGRQNDLTAIDLLMNSSLMLYPSKYEGFGLPVCDALFAGVDVLTSDRTSTKEFGEAGAIIVNPDEPWKWNETLNEPRNSRVGLDYLAENYSWKSYADEILLS